MPLIQTEDADTRAMRKQQVQDVASPKSPFGTPKEWKEEFNLMVEYVLPTTVRWMFRWGIDRLAVALIGQYDPRPIAMAGTTLGMMFCDSAVFIPLAGVNLGTSPLCAKNHGRGANRENGIVFWHAMKSSALVGIVCLALLFLQGSIFRAFGQPEEVIAAVWPFAILRGLGNPGWALSLGFTNVLGAMRIVNISLVADWVAMGIQLVGSWAVLEAGYGYVGVAAVMLVTPYISAVIAFAYVIWNGLQSKVWTVVDDPSPEGDVTFGLYMSQALPMSYSLFIENWGSTSFIMICGTLGGLAAATMGVLFAIGSTFQMSSVAVMQAVTTRIGNLIGERNYELIPGAIVVNSLAAVCITSVVGCFLQAFRADIIPVYTSDGDIYREVYAASFSNYLGLPCYALTMCMLGIMRTAGLQNLACWWGMLAIILGWVVGVHLAFDTSLGVSGLFYGNATFLGSWGTMMTVVCLRVDWHNFAKSKRKGKAKVNASREPLLS